MPNIQLANNLRYLRKQNKYNQDELSKLLSISRQAYSNYENSKRTPDLDSLLKIAKLYHVSLDTLILVNLQECGSSDYIQEEVVPYTFAADKNTGNTIYLTPDELDAVIHLRKLSKEDKQIITGFLHSKSKR